MDTFQYSWKLMLGRLWSFDPGYFKLKHGFKTVIGILISLFLTLKEPYVSQLLAGVACGVSMQGIIAKSFRYRILQVLVFNCFFAMTFLVGLAVRDDLFLSSIVLTFIAFSVNYLRRYQLQTSLAPMMAWLLCFMATYLPFPYTDMAYDNIHGLIVGLFVSALMTLAIFPDNYEKLFIANSNLVFSIIHDGFLEIRSHILGVPKKRFFNVNFFRETQIRLLKIADSNQMIEQAKIFNVNQPWVSDVLIHQYGLINAYLMMMEAYQILLPQIELLASEPRRALSQTTKAYMLIFSQMHFNSKLELVNRKKPKNLTQLTEVLSRYPILETGIVISLMNIKLSFKLFEQHIQKINEVCHENA